MALFSGCSVTLADATPLIILAGQSNAQGVLSRASEMPSFPHDVPFWWRVPLATPVGSHKWEDIKDQWNADPDLYIGPEGGLAFELRAVKYDFAIFKYTLQSTSLAREWRPGDPQGLLSSMFKEIQKAASDFKGPLLPACFIWVQGESDADTDSASASYKKSLIALISLARKEFRDIRLPIVLGLDEVHPLVTARPEVLRAQEEIALTDPNIVRSSMLGLPKADTSHLTAAGSFDQGRRLARACVEAGMSLHKPSN